MLGAIQQRLQATYEALAKERSALGYPVYALEHGLPPQELDAVRSEASEAIRYGRPSSSHWLVWCALAAEAGYRYCGDEFWPELERRAGEWRTDDYRQRLRTFFQRFHREFRGPLPEGRWAQHFNIIAWPINNAILPRYLQLHFARHLYDLRFDLPYAVITESNEVGKLLLKRYRGTTSRFIHFLQQTDLTTQIVLALRDQASPPTVSRIEPNLLHRIVDDLERTKEARSYLHDTRRVIETTKVSIAARLQPRGRTAASEGPAGSPGLQRFRLVASRFQGSRFELGFHLPDFRRAGVTREHVAGRFIQFLGDGDRWQPASALLTYSGKDRHVESFPDPNASLVAVDENSADLLPLLDDIARIEERPHWVLRRQLDGAYREILGSHVRAGQEYLILARSSPPTDLLTEAGLKPATLSATGAVAFTLKTPMQFTDAQRAALRRLHIGTKTGLVIEPAGLSPRPGELPSWLTTEAVVLAASSDTEIKKIVVSLDGGEAEFIDCAGSKTLLAFDHLPAGRHSLAFAPLVETSSGWTTPAQQFEFEVAAPRPWSEAMQGKSGFRVILDPNNADFESIANGDASISVLGPPNRSVRWSLLGYNAAGHCDLNVPLGSTKVGDSPQTFARALRRACDRHSDQIDEAYQLDLVAKLDELGRQSARFPRDVEPLRWKYEPATATVRLVDETDHSAQPVIRAYPLASPLQRQNLALEEALAGLKPIGEGALFVARCADYTASIFLSAPKEVLHDLRSLGVHQSATLSEHRGQASIRLIDGMRRWSKAKPVGHLALVRRDKTVNYLRDKLRALCCGSDFHAILASPRPTRFEEAQLRVGGSQGFGSRMRRTAWPLAPEDAAAEFVRCAGHYRIEADARIAQIALTLAFAPLQLKLADVADKKTLLAEVLDRRQLLRGAFLAQAVAKEPAVALKESA